MGFFKLGRLERGKEKSEKEDAPHEGEERKKHEGLAKPATESRSGGTRVQAGLSVNDFISKTKTQQRQGLKPSGPELIASGGSGCHRSDHVSSYI